MEYFPNNVISNNTVFRRLNAYWHGLIRSTGGRPDADAIELDLLGPILTHLAVTEYDRSGDQFQFRHLGQTVRHRFGCETDATSLDMVESEEMRVEFQEHLRTVLETRRPTVMAGSMKNSNAPFSRYECFTLPYVEIEGERLLLVSAMTYAPAGRPDTCPT